MYSKTVWKTPEEESKQRICIFTSNLTLGQFSVSASANQLSDFSISGALTRNGLLTTLLTILNFLVTVKISYFSFFTYVKISRFTITWMENSPHINKFFSFPFSSTSPVIRMPKWVHVWTQLDNEVSTWFP